MKIHADGVIYRVLLFHLCYWYFQAYVNWRFVHRCQFFHWRCFFAGVIFVWEVCGVLATLQDHFSLLLPRPHLALLSMNFS